MTLDELRIASSSTGLANQRIPETIAGTVRCFHNIYSNNTGTTIDRI